MDDGRMPWLISKLYGAHTGRMAIVVGGGPSAPSDLKKIGDRTGALIISANGHAFKMSKMQADYIWCKDHLRITRGYMAKGREREYMEPELRKYGVPIIGPNFWCDYRAIEWPMTGYNSGQQALAAAVLMGCAPIIPIGMDCFAEGQPTYFHGNDENNISYGRRPGYWNSRIQRLRQELPHSAIRGCSGLIREYFGEYRPDRQPKPGAVPTRLQKYGKMETLWIKTRREHHDGRERFARIPAGYVMPTHKAEAEKLCKLGIAERIQLFHA